MTTSTFKQNDALKTNKLPGRVCKMRKDIFIIFASSSILPLTTVKENWMCICLQGHVSGHVCRDQNIQKHLKLFLANHQCIFYLHATENYCVKC